MLEWMEKTGNIVKYKYYPEGREEFGIIILNMDTGDVEIEKPAQGYDSSYRGHAVHRIDDYYKKKEYPGKDLAAWFEGGLNDR